MRDEIRLDHVERDIQFLYRAIVFLLVICVLIMGISWFSAARQDGRLNALDVICGVEQVEG